MNISIHTFFIKNVLYLLGLCMLSINIYSQGFSGLEHKKLNKWSAANQKKTSRKTFIIPKNIALKNPISRSEWTETKYEISWNLKGELKPMEIPKPHNTWHMDNMSFITLSPKFKRKKMNIDAGRRTAFNANNCMSGNC
ncbi:hypothetical protein ACFFU9_12385 [Mariniflexile ostreae]|uniref:Uncharacterized protein n=1 Tax=Mariniflexile ostreae TaxID=1520892 RepID=A0ABV5FDM1_9FLAO